MICWQTGNCDFREKNTKIAMWHLTDGTKFGITLENVIICHNISREGNLPNIFERERNACCMKKMTTIREAVDIVRDAGYDISEYTLRKLINQGIVPARRAGNRAMVHIGKLIEYLECDDGGDFKESKNDAQEENKAGRGIRRIE